MLTRTFDTFNQLSAQQWAVAPPVTRTPTPSWCQWMGMQSQPRVPYEQLSSFIEADKSLTSRVSAGLALGQELESTWFGYLIQTPKILSEEPSSIFYWIKKASLPKQDVLSFLMSTRQLIETEQLSAARSLLEAAPIHIQNDLQVSRLRSLLAPPVVRPIEKKDVDRRLEYEWLRTEGQKYRGQWVALKGNELLVRASNLRDLRKQLEAMSVTPLPLIHRVD